MGVSDQLDGAAGHAPAAALRLRAAAQPGVRGGGGEGGGGGVGGAKLQPQGQGGELGQ